MEFTKDLLIKLRSNLDNELGDDELTKTVMPAFERAVNHTLLDVAGGVVAQVVKAANSRVKAGSAAAKARGAKAAATRAANKANNNTRIGGGPQLTPGGVA